MKKKMEINLVHAWILYITILVVALIALLITSCIKINTSAKCGYNISANNALTPTGDGDKLLKELKTEDDVERYLLLGWSECGFCQKYVPLMNDFAKKNNIELNYINNLYQLRGYWITETKDGSVGRYANYTYQKYVEFLQGSDAIVAKTVESKGLKATLDLISVPCLVKIKNGKVLGCVTEIDGHTIDEDGNVSDLTDMQKEELNKNLELLLQLK